MTLIVLHHLATILIGEYLLLLPKKELLALSKHSSGRQTFLMAPFEPNQYILLLVSITIELLGLADT